MIVSVRKIMAESAVKITQENVIFVAIIATVQNVLSAGLVASMQQEMSLEFVHVKRATSMTPPKDVSGT